MRQIGEEKVKIITLHIGHQGKAAVTHAVEQLQRLAQSLFAGFFSVRIGFTTHLNLSLRFGHRAHLPIPTFCSDTGML